MKKLSILVTICGTLFVSVCVGLLTAPPSTFAEAGLNKDVRVINTTAEAVPVRAPSALPVNVNSLPAVQVSSLPAVHIDGSTPVPTRGPDTQVPIPFRILTIHPVDAITLGFDSTAFEKVRANFHSRDAHATLRLRIFSGSFLIASHDLIGADVYSFLIELPGTQTFVSMENPGDAPVEVEVMVYGR